ncbi:hypothetical protein ACP8Y2_03725 [Herpetosiphon llansteffanensis]
MLYLFNEKSAKSASSKGFTCDGRKKTSSGELGGGVWGSFNIPHAKLLPVARGFEWWFCRNVSVKHVLARVQWAWVLNGGSAAMRW